MSLRAGVLLAAAVAFFSVGPLAANAQDYPSRPVKLLIHTPPGSLVDVLGRLVGQELGERLGQSLETWPEGSAPNYSVQTTHLKKGTVDHAAKAWSTYGGRVGVWRLMRTLERLGVPRRPSPAQEKGGQ